MSIRSIGLDVVEVGRTTGFVCQHAVIRIVDGDGITGYGEMSDLSHLPKYSIVADDLRRTLEQLLLERNPREITAINEDLLELFPEANFYYDKGSVIRCGVDLALYDLVAKQLGVSASELVGGRLRDRLKVCYPIFRNRSADDVAKNLESVQQRIREGFDVFRVYVGESLDSDEAFLAEATRLPHAPIIKSIDFSHLLDAKDALRYARKLLPYGVQLVESPAPQNDFAGLRRVRDALEVPVSEHVWSRQQLTELIRGECVDIANIALTFIGGLTSARLAAAAADAARLGCLVGTTQELGLGTAAQAIFGGTLPNLAHISDPTGPRLYIDDIVTGGVRYEEGYLHLPDRSIPGLGATVDEEKIAQHAVAGFSWDTRAAASVRDRTRVVGATS